MARRTRTVVALVLVALVALAGCSGLGGDDGDAAPSGGGGHGGGDATADGAPRNDAAGGDGEAAGDGRGGGSDRALVRTATVRLNVTGYDATRANLTAAAADRGGTVTDSTHRVREVGNETYATGTVTFRVPAGNVSGFLAAVKAGGEVRSAETSTDDVTDRLVDLEARLENKRARRDRLRALYEGANDTEDVLAVGEKLSAVQEDVERLEAERRTLADRVAYATVTVELREPRPEPDQSAPAEAPLHERGVVAAFLASVEGISRLGRALVVGLAYALPYAIAVGVPLGAVALYRRNR